MEPHAGTHDVAESIGEALRALAIVHRGMSPGAGDGSSPLHDLANEQERPRIGGKIIDYTAFNSWSDEPEGTLCRRRR